MAGGDFTFFRASLESLLFFSINTHFLLIDDNDNHEPLIVSL